MWGAWVALLAKVLFKKKLIVRGGYEAHQLSKFQPTSILRRIALPLISRLAYGNADRIILPTQNIKEYVIHTFSISEEKIAVINNFVNVDKFKPLPGNANGRCLFVGRFSRVKNVNNLIKACKLAEVGLDLCGSGPEEGKLRDLVNGISADVNFLGKIENAELPKILAKYMVFALVSYHEGSPKALLEAMSSGLVVIGSNVPGINNVITDGENGLLCKKDAASIAEKLSEVKNDVTLRSKIGCSAREYIVSNFSLDAIVSKEILLYRTLV